MVDTVDGDRLTSGAQGLEWQAVDGLEAYAANARLHSKDQIKEIAASIERFGFNAPVLVDVQGEIVAGHGRVLAAKHLKLTKVPVVRLGHLSEEEVRAYRIADNRIAENSTWDKDLLAIELGSLETAGFDVSGLGFDDGEIAKLLIPAGQASGGLDGEDEEVEPESVVVSRPGDIWQIGAHRVLCGDACSAADVARLLDGLAPNLMVTDPPYGVEYDPDWRNRADRENGKKIGARAVGVVTNDGEADWAAAFALFPGDVAYVWHAGKFGSIVEAGLFEVGFEIRSQIIWRKPRLVISRGHYHWQHEPCWYAIRKGGTGNWQGDRKQTTVWNIEHRESDTGHGTQKPVECMRRPIVNNTAPGAAVFDPFLGSGTTLVAAQTEGRVGCGLEIAPHYVDVICRRLEEICGEPARLDGDGRAYGDIAEERGADAAA